MNGRLWAFLYRKRKSHFEIINTTALNIENAEINQKKPLNSESVI